jgi:D-xylose transport system permease protein
VTKFGRYVFAIGGNPEAAELGGINVRKVTVLIFVLMGVLSAIAGAIQTARLNAGLNSTGSLLELSVIAAAVIGGTSLSGGVGTIAGAILGALIMQSLQSGMILLDISTPMQPVVIGLVLISAVWLDTVYQRRRR